MRETPAAALSALRDTSGAKRGGPKAAPLRVSGPVISRAEYPREPALPRLDGHAPVLLGPVAKSVGDGDIELGYKRLNALSPNGRIAPPEEVANVAVYLLLDAPRHLPEIIVPVDGAETAG